MSSEIAIKVENLSKCYQIYDAPRDRLLQMLARGRKQYFREFWALNNISFEVKKGETVGIVGRNGSGKSTLLQLICGTLNPSAGSIATHGRIAALLELGSGFNPEFSGRENVYLNAAVLGLSKEETDRRLDDILAFADIGMFIDQPVKTYSSGMVVRLAFAVAINVDPEILVVDEALSVGDELFQRKCFSRIEAIRAAGATILFVSHSGGTIVELCDRALLLNSGELLATGTPKKIIGSYQKLLYAPVDKRAAVREEIVRSGQGAHPALAESPESQNKANAGTTTAPEEGLVETFDINLRPSSTISYESNGAFIEEPGIFTPDGEQVNNLIRGRRYLYRYRVRFARSATSVRFGMLIKTTSGVELGGGISAASTDKGLAFVESGTYSNVEFSFQCNLNPGVYFLNTGVAGDVGGSENYLHRLVDAAMFRVMPQSENLSTGLIDFNCRATFVEQKSHD